MADYSKVYNMLLSKVYPLLVAKAERKGRTAEEVHSLTSSLTGYDVNTICSLVDTGITYGDFFSNAPSMHPGWKSFKGTVCGVHIEDIDQPLMKQIRILDKLVDDLAKGKQIEKILNSLG